jgi:fibrillarin-like rRNA methylase
MHKEIAHHIAYESFRISSMLNNLIPILKENCDKDEYEFLAKKIAAISGDIGLELLNYVFSKYPDIKDEIDGKIQKYSTLIL